MEEVAELVPSDFVASEPVQSPASSPAASPRAASEAPAAIEAADAGADAPEKKEEENKKEKEPPVTPTKADLVKNSFQFSVVDDFVQNAANKAVQSLLDTPSFFHCTVGPGCILVVPPGFILAEKTLGLTSMGIKRNIVPSSLPDLESLKHMLMTQWHVSKGGVACIEIAERIIKAQG